MYKMYIKADEIRSVLNKHNIDITGVFHVGAHNCEELKEYNKLNIINDDIIWVDAVEEKIKEAKQRGIKNIYHSVITNNDDEPITFNISNNVQSSSILEFGTHLKEHPQIKFVKKVNLVSVTVDTFFKRNKINPSKYNFWNFDIQGAELMALQGAKQTLCNVKVLYLEVNQKELYKKCALVHEIDAFLKDYNFKRVITKMTRHGWGDALYIKEEQDN